MKMQPSLLRLGFHDSWTTTIEGMKAEMTGEV
jgi:hypothetical protein